MFKRSLMISLAGAAVVVTGITGCSSNGSDGSSSTSGSSAGSSGGKSTKVIIDGRNQNVSSAARCTVAGANTNVAIGDSTDGVGAVVSNDSPPVVHSVGLGTFNGVTLGYADAAGQGNATATKTGNSYQITGTVVGVDTSNQQQTSKSFELDFTCP